MPRESPRRPVLLSGEVRARGGVIAVMEGIVRAGWSGELVIDDPIVHRTIVLDRGAIVGVRTSAIEERIGSVMRKLGMLSSEQVQTVLSKHGTRRFGEVAVELGLLPRERVLEAIVRQAEEVVAGACSVADGSFAFTDGFDSDLISAPVALDALEAIAEARGDAPPSSRADVLPRFNEAIASVFQAVTAQGKGAALRSALASYAEGNVLDRALFANMRMYGTIEEDDVDAALAGTPVERREDTLRGRLHEALQYALFVACAELPRDAERALLRRVEPTLAALSVGRKTATATPVARVLLVRRSAAPSQAPEVTKKAPRLELVSLAGEPRAEGRVTTEPLPLVRAPERVTEDPVAPEPPPEPLPVRRSRWPVLLVAAALIAIAAFIGTRSTTPAIPAPAPAATRSVPPPIELPTVVPDVPPSFAPSSATSDYPIPTPPPPAASASVTGVVRATEASAKVWIDGRSVGESPGAFAVPCGTHVVRIGGGGQPQLVDVPCGGEITATNP